MFKRYLMEVLACFKRFPPLERLDERLSDAEKAVENAEKRAEGLATQVALMEGRIDPLRSFIQSLEDFHREDRPARKSDGH